MTFRLRPPVPAEYDELAAIVREGMEGYREFAGADWEPPPAEQEHHWLLERLALPGAWARVGEAADGAIAGHVAFLPATLARNNVTDATLAHLYHLFVRRPHWGSGLATTLLAHALDEAALRGYAAMRLFTPAGQRRARRFYEREGWRPAGDPVFDERLGLTIVEYRIPLPRPAVDRRARPA